MIEAAIIIRSFITSLFRQGASATSIKSSDALISQKPCIFKKDEHGISRSVISKNALKVLDRLHQAGLQAYLVGGSVRDLLLGHKPKDFDIATDAHPEKVHQIFRNSRLIGRRFRLVHVFFGRENIEVATFRASQDKEYSKTHRSESGMILRDNIYGNIIEDAWRRDFSINSLYFNFADESVVDYTGGMVDLKKMVIRILGDAYSRYHEDPVRMLRAIRLAAKLNFDIHPDTAKPIPELSGLLLNVSPARLFDEMVKIFHSGKSFEAFKLMRHYGLFSVLFPQVEASFVSSFNRDELALKFIELGFKNTDHRVANHQSLNPAFMFAVMLWCPLQNQMKHLKFENKKTHTAILHTISDLFRQQSQYIALSRRITSLIREIWSLQRRLRFTKSTRALLITKHPRFRAAFDFLSLRAKAGEPVQDLVNFWEQYKNHPTNQ